LEEIFLQQAADDSGQDLIDLFGQRVDEAESALMLAEIGARKGCIVDRRLCHDVLRVEKRSASNNEGRDAVHDRLEHLLYPLRTVFITGRAPLGRRSRAITERA
jgi:hypothetical protein